MIQDSGNITQKNVYFLGPTGSYSSVVAENLFSNNKFNLVSCNDFNQIFINTKKDSNSLGILPIENSVTSNIHINTDKIFNKELYIVGEYFLPIKLDLIGLDNSDIRNINTVASHSQALLQCQNIIKQLDFKEIQSNSTAESVNYILESNNPNIAAIANYSKITTNKIRLKLLKADIGDFKNNNTRFLIMSSKPEFTDNADKLSIVLTLPHKAGSLAKLLIEISDIANLTKIESRPIPETDWQYRFWVDLTSKDLDKTINIIQEKCVNYFILGKYKAYDYTSKNN